MQSAAESFGQAHESQRKVYRQKAREHQGREMQRIHEAEDKKEAIFKAIIERNSKIQGERTFLLWLKDSQKILVTTKEQIAKLESDGVEVVPELSEAVSKIEDSIIELASKIEALSQEVIALELQPGVVDKLHDNALEDNREFDNEQKMENERKQRVAEIRAKFDLE